MDEDDDWEKADAAEEQSGETATAATDEDLANKVEDMKIEEESQKKAASSPTKATTTTSSPSKEETTKQQQEEDEEEEVMAVDAVEGDPREHLNLVFIGHVDAGKSTLSGNILYLTDNVDKRTIEKYEAEAKERNRESWFLAFIMDTNEEERAKGKTVEVGRATFETELHRYSILDAPGHKNYVPNMIMGASQADVGVLVISARKGEIHDKGVQTREHALLLPKRSAWVIW